MEFELNKAKAQAAILYICNRMADAPGFGSVMLSRVLYYVDRVAYVKLGKPVTGFTYIKQEQGPTPAPGQFLPLRRELIESGSLALDAVEYFGQTQKRLVAHIPPNPSAFSSDELAIMEKLMSDFRSLNGTNVSLIPHEEIAWKCAAENEELPYYSFLATEAPIEEDDLVWARAEIQRYRHAEVH